MAFISSTQTKTVRAKGAMTIASPWKMPFTCSSTKSISNSTKACAWLERRKWPYPPPSRMKPSRPDAQQDRHAERIDVDRPEVPPSPLAW